MNLARAESFVFVMNHIVIFVLHFVHHSVVRIFPGTKPLGMSGFIMRQSVGCGQFIEGLLKKLIHGVYISRTTHACSFFRSLSLFQQSDLFQDDRMS